MTSLPVNRPGGTDTTSSFMQLPSAPIRHPATTNAVTLHISHSYLCSSPHILTWPKFYSCVAAWHHYLRDYFHNLDLLLLALITDQDDVGSDRQLCDPWDNKLIIQEGLLIRGNGVFAVQQSLATVVRHAAKPIFWIFLFLLKENKKKEKRKPSLHYLWWKQLRKWKPRLKMK